MSTVRISDVLRGCEVGQIQTVGFMQVIPLVSDVTFDHYVAPIARQVGNPGYANLTFDNSANAEADMIVPAQMAVLTKQRAQDHSMTTAGWVAKKKNATFNSAVCIQQSQPGNIQASDDNRLIILPVTLRESALKTRGGTELGRLWPAIGEFLNETGVRSTASNLIAFLDQYETQLDQFVAEFEPVTNQIGAIVLIGGKVVGVERAPNTKYWLQVWSMLIRECYGSMAILESRKAGGVPPVPKTRVELRQTKGRSFSEKIADLKDALRTAKNLEYQRVKNLVDSVCESDLPVKTSGTSTGGKKVEDVGDVNARFVGQLFRENESVVYASLISTKHWKDNEEWLTAKPFSM